MAPAVHHVAEEQKSELDPVTVHSHNMVVKPVQGQLQQVLAVIQFHAQLVEAGVHGALMNHAVLHVVGELKLVLDPVTVHSHNMVV